MALSGFPAPPALLNLPRVSHESGGGYPVHSSGAAGDIARACAALQAALDAEKDPEDRAEIAKLLASCHKIEADRQKERDSAMGLSAQHKFIRRQKQQSGGY